MITIQLLGNLQVIIFLSCDFDLGCMIVPCLLFVCDVIFVVINQCTML